VCVVDGPVPVIVTVYPTVEVLPVVVIVAEASPGTLTVVGLTVHTGGDFVVWLDDT
jgi:hypothetical protein